MPEILNLFQRDELIKSNYFESIICPKNNITILVISSTKRIEEGANRHATNVQLAYK